MKKPENGRLLIVQLLSNELEKQKFLFRPGEKRQPLLFPSVIQRIENSEQNISFFCNLILNTNKRPKDLQNCIENIDKMIHNHFVFVDKYAEIYPEEMKNYLSTNTKTGEDVYDYKDYYFVRVFEKMKDKFNLEESKPKTKKNDSENESKNEVSQLREEIKSLKSFMEGLLLQKTGGAK